MAELVITKENFEKEVLNSDIPVLIDFWAAWCAPCRMLAPTIEGIAKDYEGKVKVGKINVDEQPELAGRYGIMSIPTVVVFKDGKPAAQSVGFVPKEKLVSML